MPPPKAKTITVTCPQCGHEQAEPKGAYSTVCKKCRTHIRLEETAAPAKPAVRKAAPPKKEPTNETAPAATDAPKPASVPQASKPAKVGRSLATPEIAKVQVICFQCGTQLDVPAAAESTMCKRCSSHVDLRDYSITSTVSKNFRTHGKLVLEEKGYILNTDSLVGDAVIKGRFIGKINAVRTLEIYTSAQIKGSFATGRLILPASERFRCNEVVKIAGADISGEFVANVQCSGTFTLRASGRLFGDVEAQNFVIESGAVFVGNVKIGKAASIIEPVAKERKAAAVAAPTLDY